MEASAGSLPRVGDQIRNVFATKNHLLFCCLVLLDGRIPKDHDKSSCWKLPKKDGTGRHKELHEVMERGLMVLLLCKSIWVHESLDDIRLIYDVDNQDHVSCMPDHEIHMFDRIMKKCVEVESIPRIHGVANPETLFEIIYEDLQSVAGNFHKKDCTHI